MTNLSFSDLTHMISEAETNLSAARYKNDEENITHWTTVIELHSRRKLKDGNYSLKKT
jgi:hypothetical protein